MGAVLPFLGVIGMVFWVIVGLTGAMVTALTSVIVVGVVRYWHS
jgi:hypothetical protein